LTRTAVRSGVGREFEEMCDELNEAWGELEAVLKRFHVMSVEYYLVDREREELHCLGKSSAWPRICGSGSHPRSHWRSEWSLFLALWRLRPQYQNEAGFNWALFAADHVWSVLQGAAPHYDPEGFRSGDRFTVVPDTFDGGFSAVVSWLTVWDAYVRDDECRAWADARYGPGLFDVFRVMES
jgi:hypothetical protein